MPYTVQLQPDKNADQRKFYSDLLIAALTHGMGQTGGGPFAQQYPNPYYQQSTTAAQPGMQSGMGTPPSNVAPSMTYNQPSTSSPLIPDFLKQKQAITSKDIETAKAMQGINPDYQTQVMQQALKGLGYGGSGFGGTPTIPDSVKMYLYQKANEGDEGAIEQLKQLGAF